METLNRVGSSANFMRRVVIAIGIFVLVSCAVILAFLGGNPRPTGPMPSLIPADKFTVRPCEKVQGIWQCPDYTGENSGIKRRK